MSKRKRYEFEFSGVTVAVDVEPEGEARYMVRMARTDTCRAFSRIGTLTGAGRRWVAEYGSGPSARTSSAETPKQACFDLVRWALTPPAGATQTTRHAQLRWQRPKHLHQATVTDTLFGKPNMDPTVTVA